MKYVKAMSKKKKVKLQKTTKSKRSANTLDQQGRMNTHLPTTMVGAGAGQGNSIGVFVCRGGIYAKFLG